MQYISLFTEQKSTKACFFNVDSRYRRGAAKFGVEDIDTNLCMHLVYGYAALRGLRLEMSDKGVLSSEDITSMCVDNFIICLSLYLALYGSA